VQNIVAFSLAELGGCVGRRRNPVCRARIDAVCQGFMKKLRGNVLSALKEELIAEQTNVDVWMCGGYLWRVR
jgi:hypothetical protein